jgi:hypothetical protein
MIKYCFYIFSVAHCIAKIFKTQNEQQKDEKHGSVEIYPDKTHTSSTRKK